MKNENVYLAMINHPTVDNPTMEYTAKTGADERWECILSIDKPPHSSFPHNVLYSYN
jgi:hypothetical protein